MARQVLLTKPISQEHPRIRLQTILYRTERIKGFKYGKVRMHEVDGSASLSVRILPRRNSRPYCSGCGRRGPVHDKLTGNSSTFPFTASPSSFSMPCGA